MNKFSLVAKNLGGVISKNSPSILTGIAVTSFLSTVIFAVKVTPKAYELIKQDSREAHDGDPYAFTMPEAIVSAWKEYIPAIIFGSLTIVCIIGANKINTRRNAALAGLYSLTETAFKEYKSKVTETIGKGKEQKIRDAISEDHIRKNPVGQAEVIFTGKGEVLCYDNLSGRYFKGDIEKIRRAQNTINIQLMSDVFIPLNEFYLELDLNPIDLGRDVGWDINRKPLDISFSAQLSETNEPCLVLDYEVIPQYI